MAFQVALEIYEGPLELLYYLIKKQRLSVTEVSLVKITHQFLETIEIMREIDLDIAADFLRIAAILIDLKAKELLPPSLAEDEEEDSDVKDLLKQLEELKKYKTMAQFLEKKAGDQEKIWFRESDDTEGEQIVEFQPTLYDLLKALKELLETINREEPLPTIEPEKFSVVDRMNELLEFLVERPVTTFISLFEGDRTKVKIIITFLAVLELIRMQLIIFQQHQPFGQIIIQKNFSGQAPTLSDENEELHFIRPGIGEYSRASDPDESA